MMKNPNEPAMTQAKALHGLPAFLFFKEGKVVDAILGVQPKAEIRQVLNKVLAA